MKRLSRRAFLSAAAASAAFRAAPGWAQHRAGASGAGLVRDPEGVFDLARGLSCRILTRTGDPMSDGLLTPGAPDGMAAFPDSDGKVRIVRNHELARWHTVDGTGAGATTDAFAGGGALPDASVYDRSSDGAPAPGGTTTLVYDPQTGAVERSWMSLAGTLVNCAGGPTPWNSWLSCEEVIDIGAGDGALAHGYVFEVPAAHEGPVDPVPLKAMGRFKHEAVAVDPASGALYLTEDQAGAALFYRFLPDAPGELARGGRLQALAVRGQPGMDTRNWSGRAILPGQPLEAVWIDLEDIDNPDGDLAQRSIAAGAAQFTRGEGCAMGQGEVFFTCTDGGAAQLGQIWRYRPSGPDGGVLDLFHESAGQMEMCDNLTVAPWGDLIVAEDGPGGNRLWGLRPDGGLYPVGSNALVHENEISELTGPCFSPDGSTLFFNIQRPGLTLAITGDWDAVRGA